MLVGHDGIVDSCLVSSSCGRVVFVRSLLVSLCLIESVPVENTSCGEDIHSKNCFIFDVSN